MTDHSDTNDSDAGDDATAAAGPVGVLDARPATGSPRPGADRRRGRAGRRRRRHAQRARGARPLGGRGRRDGEPARVRGPRQPGPRDAVAELDGAPRRDRAGDDDPAPGGGCGDRAAAAPAAARQRDRDAGRASARGAWSSCRP